MDSVKNLLGDEGAGETGGKSLDFANSCPSLSFKQVRFLASLALPPSSFPTSAINSNPKVCFASIETMGIRNLLRLRPWLGYFGTTPSKGTSPDSLFGPFLPSSYNSHSLTLLTTCAYSIPLGNLPPLRRSHRLCGALHDWKHPRPLIVRFTPSGNLFHPLHPYSLAAIC